MTGKRAWQYYPHKRAVVEITQDLEWIKSIHCSKLDVTSPLTANFDFRDGALRWELGPYDQGEYSVVLAEGVEAWEVPRKGGLNLRGLPGLTLRVKWEGEGRAIYSDVIELDFAKRPQAQWRR